MKTLKLTIIFIISFGYFSHSQTIWAPPGAEWYYNYQQWDNVGYTKIKYIGDTIIDTKICKKLEKTKFIYSYSSNKYDTTALGEEYTYAKNDTVFYYRFNKFFVLYDFSAQQGNSWQIAGNNNWGECDSVANVTVNTSDTVIINGFNLKRVKVDYNDTLKWLLFGDIIERIGALSYMFPENNCVIDAPSEGGMLRCYYDNELGHYKRGIIQCDSIVKTGIKESFLNDNYLYPNLLTMFSPINIKSKDKLGKVEIFNINGQPVYSVFVESNMYQLNLNFLNNGFYVVVFNNCSHKLIVSR